MSGARSGHALVVGVSRYRNYERLPDAVRADAEDIASTLRDPAACGLNACAVKMLVDDEACADALRRELRDAASQSSATGILLFYFSGHGHRAIVGPGERTWLLPHDADPRDLDRTAISAEELRSLLADVVSRRQVLLLDACHSGGIGSAKSPAAPAGFGKSGVDALAVGAGRTLLSSSRSDELSLVLRGERNSVFTAALLEALRGATLDRGDGMIGVLDVFDYVSRVVPTRADQHPVLRADHLEGNFALARRPTAAGLAGPERGRTGDVSSPTLARAATPETAAALVAALSSLYPVGPTQDEVWTRAGGDVARLRLQGSGLAQWHAAIAKAALGGGGTTLRRLLQTVASDYPENPDIAVLLSAS